jgi:hypothetical protein
LRFLPLAKIKAILAGETIKINKILKIFLAHAHARALAQKKLRYL